MSPTILRSIRLALASLLTTALLAQALIISSSGGQTEIGFLYILNLITIPPTIVMLTMLAIQPERLSSPAFGLFRGSVTVLILVGAALRALGLAMDLFEPFAPEPWVDVTLHVVAPVLLTADWLTQPSPIGKSSLGQISS